MLLVKNSLDFRRGAILAAAVLAVLFLAPSVIAQNNQCDQAGDEQRRVGCELGRGHAQPGRPPRQPTTGEEVLLEIPGRHRARPQPRGNRVDDEGEDDQAIDPMQAGHRDTSNEAVRGAGPSDQLTQQQRLIEELFEEIALVKANFVDRAKLSERFATLAKEFNGQS